MTLALPFTRKADGTESKAVPAAVRLCSEHLRKFTEDPDQNLKYLVRKKERGGNHEVYCAEWTFINSF